MSLSAADQTVLKEAFELHESAPGQLSAANLGEVARIVGANPSEDELLQYTSSKTTLSVADVEAFLSTKKLHQDPSTILSEAFAMFDVDGSGVIDASEFRTVMANLGERFEQWEVEEMMRVTEVNADGTVNYKDFIDFASKHK